MITVSVPFNAGRGLMLFDSARTYMQQIGFSTLQCGSWIDAQTSARRRQQ